MKTMAANDELENKIVEHKSDNGALQRRVEELAAITALERLSE